MGKKALLITESSIYTNKRGEVQIRGGAALCFHNIAKCLKKLGFEVMVFSIKEFQDQHLEEDIEGIHYKRIKVNSRTTFFILKYLKEALVLSKNVDFVFVNQFTPHLVLPFMKGCKKIAVIHDIYKFDGISFWVKQFGFISGVIGYFVEKIQLFFDKKYADSVMTVSEASKNKIIRALGKNVEAKIVVNPYPININDFFGNEKKDDYLLFVGRFVAYKHPEDVLFALKKVRQRYQNFKGIFVIPRFEKSVMKNFKEKMKKMNFSDEEVEIIHCPEIFRLKKIIAKAKILVQPSYVEGQGIIVYESLASNTPVVAYALEAYEIVLNDGKNSRLVKKGNHEELGTACLEMLADYENFHSNCRSSIDEFSNEKFVKTLELLVQ